MRPGVVFNPAIPQKCAGMRIDPPPSLPMPPAEQKDAIAAASPPLGSARCPVEVPRIVGAAGDQIIRFIVRQELGRVGLAQNDGARGAQACYRGGVLRGLVTQAESAAAQRRQALHIETILYGDRNPVQQPWRFAPQHRAFCQPWRRYEPPPQAP